MTNSRLRRTFAGVSALIAAILSQPAFASQTLTVKPGDSVDSLARRFHVSVKDIEQANHIGRDTLLRDGRKIVIPDPPKFVSVRATMRRSASIHGDRISIRKGPAAEYRRVTMLDRGAEVVVTSTSGEWSQVEIGSRAGWLRTKFLSAYAGPTKISARPVKKNLTKVANRQEESVSRRPKRRVAAKKMAHAARTESKKHHRVAQNHRRSAHRVAKAVSHRAARFHAEASTDESPVVRTALASRGTPYHFGGTSRSGFDCSGFTRHVYARQGVELPHSAAEQFNHGRRVEPGKLKKGDLVFFHTTRPGISHVGIYIGDGKFVHASSAGGRVQVNNLSEGYYRSRLRGARRVR